MSRQTLAAAVTLPGLGVHSGQIVHMTCSPAEGATGIRFRLQGGAAGEWLAADLDYVDQGGSERRTVLKHPSGWRVETPEHLLAACAALGVTDLDVELTHSEVPILDGSAAPYVQSFVKVGLRSVAGDAPRTWTVKRPVTFRYEDTEFSVLPGADTLRIAYTIEFPGTVVGTSSIEETISAERFGGHIAAARTFVLESDVEKLRQRGLIKGGDPKIAVVIGKDQYLNPPLRFPDECVRHKVIDFLGDVALLGGTPRGHFLIHRAGHAAHLALCQYLRKESLLQCL